MAKDRWILTVGISLAIVVAACVGRLPAPDGELDCAEDETWYEQGSVLPDTVGSSTQEEAAGQALGRFRERLGGEIAIVSDTHGSLMIDGLEQVVAVISEAPAGGWIVLTITGCGPYPG